MATIEQIKELRALTGVGVSAVREALEATNGDMEEAAKYLRKKGIAKMDKRKDKEAANGILGTYVHPNNRLVVVVEVACETDFAAKSPDLIEFANTLALHIAALNPEVVAKEDINPETLEKFKETNEKDLEGKPEEVKAKIMEGKLTKYYEEIVLLNQPLFTDTSKTVQDYLNELIAKIGEKTQITRFVKMAIATPSVSCNL